MALENVVEVHDGKVVGAFTTQAKNVSYGQGTVEDALDGLTALPKIKYFDVAVPASVSNYNYSSDKPADFSIPLTAMSIQGGGAAIMQVGGTTIYFASPMSNNGTIRILYVAT